MVTQSNTLKVTISGSFKASDAEIESYERVVGIIPCLATVAKGTDRLSKAEQMIIRRYAKIWIGQARKKDAHGNVIDEPKYKRVEKVRQVFIDSIEDNEDPEAILSYVNKNVMDMNAEELQDFAAANDLSGIPLFKVNSLAHARRVAWSEYCIKVLKLEDYSPEDKEQKQNLYDFRTNGFNPNKYEPVIADAEIRTHDGYVATIEETIDRENIAMQGKAKAVVNDTSKSRLSLQQLKDIADSKGIKYNPNIGYEQLYKRIYEAKAA